MSKRSRRRKKPGAYRWIVPVLVFIAVAALVFFGGKLLQSGTEGGEIRGDANERYQYENTVDYNGGQYRMRRGLTSILLIGVDRTNDSVRGMGYRNHGQADFLRLVVIDSVQKKISQIEIDRDTMTPITVLGILGDKSGMRNTQICLAHSYGDGAEMSCELTENAVSNLLFDVPIDFYISMKMDGISVLNDAVGGVTVTLQDDFSHLDPEMVAGRTITLAGDQAEYFARGRMSVGVGTNESRMARQQEYISKLTARLDEKIRTSKTFVGEVFDSISEYLVTDIPRGRLINEVWAARDYDRPEVLRPEGYHQIGGDGFTQYIVDDTALQAMIIGLFYEPVE